VNELDGAGRPIKVGDKVRFRGRVYTIRNFIQRKSTERGGCSLIVFEEDVHVEEVADEWAVDLVQVAM